MTTFLPKFCLILKSVFKISETEVTDSTAYNTRKYAKLYFRRSVILRVLQSRFMSAIAFNISYWIPRFRSQVCITGSEETCSLKMQSYQMVSWKCIIQDSVTINNVVTQKQSIKVTCVRKPFCRRIKTEGKQV